MGALRTAAGAAGWRRGKRLAPVLGGLVPALEREGVLRRAPADRGRLVAVRARPIDRRLLASGVLAADQVKALAAAYAGTGPRVLRQQLVAALEGL